MPFRKRQWKFINRLKLSIYCPIILSIILTGHPARAKSKAKKSSVKKKQKVNSQGQISPRAKPKARKSSVTKRSEESFQRQREQSLPKFRKYNGSISLRELLRTALEHNPKLLSLKKRVQVAREMEKKAGAWPDLMAGISVSNFPLNSFNPSDTPMSGIQYSLSQRFPILKRLALERKLAKLATKIAEADLREAEVWVEFSVKREVFTIWFLHRSLEILRELYNLAGQAAEVARSKYSVGRASQQNYLLAYTLQAKIRNQMVEIVAKERRTRFKLWRLVGAGLDVLKLNLPPLRDPPPPPAKKTLLDRAFDSRGAIKRWELSGRRAKVLLQFARVRYWPDVTLNIAIRQRFPNKADQGYPFFSVGVKVPIPSWGNYARHGLVKEAMARFQFANSKLYELKIQIKEQTDLILEEISQYTRQLKVYSTKILPLAEQTYRASLSSYKVDRVDFFTLLSDLRTLFRYKLEYEKLRFQRAVADSKLKAVAGEKTK